MPISALYTSPMKRCRQTTAVLSSLLGIDPVQIDDLREFGIGEWERLPFEDLARKHSFVATITADELFAPPGGESLRAVADRVVPALQAIHANHHPESRVLVVGHAVTFAIALSCLLDGHPRHWTRYRLENCSITELAFIPEPRLGLYNMTFHLL